MATLISQEKWKIIYCLWEKFWLMASYHTESCFSILNVTKGCRKVNCKAVSFFKKYFTKYYYNMLFEFRDQLQNWMKRGFTAILPSTVIRLYCQPLTSKQDLLDYNYVNNVMVRVGLIRGGVRRVVIRETTTNTAVTR